MAYDKKYKKRAIEYHEEGNTVRKTAQTFKISPNTLNTWLKQYREKGDFINKSKGHRKAKINEEALLDYYEKNPDAYQYEAAEYFNVTPSAVCIALKRFKITRKKKQNGTKNKILKK